MTPESLLLDAYADSLNAINGATLTRQWAQLQSQKQSFNGPHYLLAIGKAAPAMARGIAEIFSAQIDDALVITTRGNHSACPFDIHYAAHPILDDSSLQAGQRALQFVQALPANATLLVLLSGGASALADVLPATMTLSAYQDIVRYLLAHHFDIHAINAVRKRLSLIKNGGLLSACPVSVRVVQCLLSDVPDNRLSSIGSGPFASAHDDEMPALPDWIAAHLLPIKPADGSRQVENHLLASNEHWLQQWRAHLPQPVVLSARLSGDALAMAANCAECLRDGAPGLYVWGGELTVQLPAASGRGGRLQHFALALLLCLMQTPFNAMAITVLAVSSDGCDGQSDAAGVLITPALLARAVALQDELSRALNTADSYAFWQQLGGQVFCSNTESNVMDAVVIIKELS